MFDVQDIDWTNDWGRPTLFLRAVRIKFDTTLMLVHHFGQREAPRALQGK
jgi:hypothetical protein